MDVHTKTCQEKRKSRAVRPTLAILSLVLMPLSTAYVTADPAARLTDLLESVQGVRGQGQVGDKDDGGGSGGGEPPVDPEAEANAFFESDVHPLVYPTCYTACHQAGGASGGSDLVLVGPGANQIAANNAAFVNFITIFGSSSTLLTRISGGGHPGGVVYSAGSSGYQTIETWTQYYD